MVGKVVERWPDGAEHGGDAFACLVCLRAKPDDSHDASD